MAPDGRLSGADGAPRSAPRSLVPTLAGFARTIALSEELPEVLRDLTERASSLAASRGAGVSVVSDGRLVHVACDWPAVGRMQLAQDRYREGPCLEAVGSGRPVIVGDLVAEGGRWPRYAEQAREAGIGSVAALPLGPAGAVVGAIGVYDPGPRAWTDTAIRALSVLGDLAAGFLVLSARVQEQRRATGELQSELDARVIVEQARGLIAAQRRVGLDRALELLQDHADRHGVGLRESAEAVVRLGLRL